MSQSMLERPVGFALRVPESWWEFDIWRATRTGDLARLIDARIAQAPELASHRGDLLKVLRQAAEHAERNGARFCAVAADVVDDAGSLLATAMVFQADGVTDSVVNTVEAIAGQISAVAESAWSPWWRRVKLVEIAAGRAVRVYGVEATNLGSEPVDAVVMQTIVPVPGDQGVLNLVLISPQTQLAAPMLDLFDAISNTLAWSAPH